MSEPKPPEVRLNDDSTLDEIVGDGLFHLEQMHKDMWWMCFEQAGKRVDVWLRSERPITAVYEEDESTYRPAPVAADAAKSVAAQDMDKWFAKTESALKLYGDAEYQRAIASSDEDYEDAGVNVDRAKDRLLLHLRARPAPVAVAPVIEQGSHKSPVTIWYMRDNHTFRKLPLDVESAVAILREESTASVGRYGMLCSKHLNFQDVVHAQGIDTFDSFIAEARTWLQRAIDVDRNQAVAPVVQQPAAWHLDENEAEMLRDFIGEDGNEITLRVGMVTDDDGSEQHGLMVLLTEHPEEGAVLLKESPVAAPAPQQELTDTDILHEWDKYVGDPCEKYPLTDADKIKFAHAILAAKEK